MWSASAAGISQDSFFVEKVREAVRYFNEDLLPFAFPVPEIHACKFFNDANLVGAYRHFLRMQAKRAAVNRPVAPPCGALTGRRPSFIVPSENECAEMGIFCSAVQI